MSVLENLHPTYSEKTLGAMKADRAVKRITFERTEARPGETLYVSVPKLNENEVLVPGSLALRPFWRARQQLPCPERHAGAR